MLLHGTYWSRVWFPVLGRLAKTGLRPIAVDLPGLGHSAGELTLETATVPALADWVVRFASALKLSGPTAVAGHDIGGAIAQHLLVHDRLTVCVPAGVGQLSHLRLLASATVARFQGPGTAADDVLAARRQAVTAALGGAATEQRIADYLNPWTTARVRRSWTVLAAAADSRYTLDLLPALRRSTTPKLLIWGEDDPFETVDYAERFAAEIPHTTLIRVPDAGHIPTENAPHHIACALIDFFTA
ncbi:alpha/beta fold hydrolase [Rhodococcus jostii]|uniref:alpha/beta fold hydrolase n=1 Tax=Rhodococcus jostii TaxID=132919 RepID=UPI003625C8AA